MRDSLRLKIWAGAAILFGLVSSSALAAASSAGGAECVVEKLRRDFSKSQAPEISIEKLTSEIASRRARVPEFQFIRKEAEKQGLRVWLFGGTAAGYGHYVKWDLLREAGDARFQKARFDYDYTNIYRSTQDLDIVVDGNAEQAKEFQMLLKAQFPYFVGSKSTPWEVRSLREASDDKGAILDDFGFMNQHTDSNSTGMIELTDPPKGESIVRDVRDWKNAKDSQFLKDVHEGQLTYYHSPTHEQTERAKAGKNPPIFSVVRALTKAFQYDLKIRPEDLAVMKKEIDQFDSKRDLTTVEAQHWIDKNGRKLYQHAVDIEYASKTLEELGLKKKLIAIENNPKTTDTLAWWINKEPLKSLPVGQGSGKTAKELGLDIVAHETGNFLAYESITRAHTGEPNVLISRKETPGEMAYSGNGFYTKIGTSGAAGTGITIRFKVDPQAREGTDFTIVKISDGDHVIWQNKSAIRVIPESLEMTPSQYFEFLAEGKEISKDDKALLWKLKRKLEHRMASGIVDPTELKKIRALVTEKVATQSPNHELLFQEWLRLEGIRRPSPEIEEILDLIKTQSYKVDPSTFVESLNRFTQGTELQKWVNEEYIPYLLKSFKPTIGERVIEKSLASRRPVLREFGLRALAEAEKERPSARIAMLRALVSERPNRPIDQKAAEAWLRSNLEKNSALPIFEKLAGRDSNALALLHSAPPESFQFHKFEIPPGGKKVRLGSPENEGRIFDSSEGHRKNETIRDVVLTIPFEIQLTPVTQLQWAMVMSDQNPNFRNPAYFKKGGYFGEGGRMLNGVPLHPNLPIENVSWDDAQEFIHQLNRLDRHYYYRLPTEAEWEASARAGTETAYSYGSNDTRNPQELSLYAWHAGIRYDGNSKGKPHDVASLNPNPAGLYDMHGNVWEWVEDAYQEIPPGGRDPVVRSSNHRVTRGGSWADGPQFLRSSYRNMHNPDYRNMETGFRLVRIPKP